MIIPREVILASDAIDNHTCLFLREDCIEAHPLTWLSYRNGKELCPCKTCELYIEFSKSNVTLLEFRETLRDIKSKNVIDTFCEAY